VAALCQGQHNLLLDPQKDTLLVLLPTWCPGRCLLRQRKRHVWGEGGWEYRKQAASLHLLLLFHAMTTKGASCLH
jgi:hypothetical protein